MEELRFSEYCANCKKSLEGLERILFVEKEVGRCFCTEQCIKDYFQPVVDMKYEEWQALVREDDFSPKVVAKLSSYRGLTLEEPDEIWVEKSDSGERFYTFISRYQNGDESFWYIVQCLTIDGVPSFVFLAVPSRDEDLVQFYRKGSEVPLASKESKLLESEMFSKNLPEDQAPTNESNDEAESAGNPIAMNEGGEVPAYLAELANLYNETRSPADIPQSQFEHFAPYAELTLDDPSEIWQYIDNEGNEWITFISTQVTTSDDEFFMIVICEAYNDPTQKGKQLEIVMSFPTIDPTLPARFRRGIASLNVSTGMGRATRLAA